MHHRRNAAHAGALHQLCDVAALAKAVPKYVHAGCLAATTIEGGGGSRGEGGGVWLTSRLSTLLHLHSKSTTFYVLAAMIAHCNTLPSTKNKGGSGQVSLIACFRFTTCAFPPPPRLVLCPPSNLLRTPDKKLDNDDPEHMKVIVRYRFRYLRGNGYFSGIVAQHLRDLKSYLALAVRTRLCPLSSARPFTRASRLCLSTRYGSFMCKVKKTLFEVCLSSRYQKIMLVGSLTPR